jgi:hypothetical protein
MYVWKVEVWFCSTVGLQDTNVTLHRAVRPIKPDSENTSAARVRIGRVEVEMVTVRQLVVDVAVEVWMRFGRGVRTVKVKEGVVRLQAWGTSAERPRMRAQDARPGRLRELSDDRTWLKQSNRVSVRR